MQEKTREPQYYRIRASLLWSGIAFTITVMGAICFGDEIFEKWQESQEWIEISYEGLKSELENTDSCYLCGGSDRGFMEIGLLSLNDWCVLDFKLKNYDEQGREIPGKGYEIAWGNAGGGSYSLRSSPSRGMSSIEVTLPRDYDLDTTVIREHLCQICLDKITATLNFSKWKYEKKRMIPLCLVDFTTLEIYSLQDWHVGCSIRDYWAEMDFRENQIEVKVFYLPER